MGIIDKIKSLFGGGKQSDLVEVNVKDDNCGNEIQVLFRKSSEIKRVNDKSREAEYEVNKVVICDQCYNKIKLHVDFDKNYKIINKSTKDMKLDENSTFSEKDIKKAISDKKNKRKNN